MENNLLRLIARFPMGPKTRAFIGITDHDYIGEQNEKPSPKDVADFGEAFLNRLEEFLPQTSHDVVDLLEELVGMNQPLLAIKLIDSCPPGLFPESDFRAQLHLGNASMLIGEMGRAEAAFLMAQKQVPEETAPYYNLAQIYLHDGFVDQSEKWTLAGLDVDPNHMGLWENYCSILQSKNLENHALADALTRTAQSKNSWAGLSLGAEIARPSDVQYKLDLMENFWNEGVRTIEFAVEYTALLGMAGKYEKIPQAIWQLTSLAQKPEAWQLQVHLAQAFMGLGRDDDAKETLKALAQIDGIPPKSRQIIEQLLEGN